MGEAVSVTKVNALNLEQILVLLMVRRGFWREGLEPCFPNYPDLDKHLKDLNEFGLISKGCHLHDHEWEPTSEGFKLADYLVSHATWSYTFTPGGKW